MKTNWVTLVLIGLLSLSAIAKKSSTRANTQETTIVFVGDSLTEGYGVQTEETFPNLVGMAFKKRGHSVKIINGGISGSVSADADRRVQWYLKQNPKILVLELGANDALKGTPIAVIKKNLKKAIELAQKNNVKVLLIGIQVFENFGEAYTLGLKNMYKDLAKETKVVLMPFLLEGVALKKELNLPDGKHPNAKGHQIIAENLQKYLEPLL